MINNKNMNFEFKKGVGIVIKVSYQITIVITHHHAALYTACVCSSIELQLGILIHTQMKHILWHLYKI